MKIAVLTFHRAFSYGALLQCYALTTFLRKRGHEVSLLRSDLKGEVSWKYRLNSFTKCSVFRNFRKNYLPPEVSPLEKIDLYIVGSDQVWNPTFPIRPLDYFFSFLPDTAKRISYAASFGMDVWNYGDVFTRQVGDLLKKFSFITVREEDSKKICNEIWGIEPKVVLDPTFLLEDFGDLYSVPNENNGTLFCFRVGNSEDWKTFPEDLADSLGLKLFMPSLEKRIKLLPMFRGLNATYLSVQEWLNAIRSSSFVLTDSFHTVVFAILNRKPFLVLPSVRSRMGRVKSLLSLLGIENRYFSSIEEVKSDDSWRRPIDYDAAFSMLEKLRVQSTKTIDTLLCC